MIAMNKVMIIALLGLFIFGCATEVPQDIPDQKAPEPVVQQPEPVVPVEEPKTVTPVEPQPVKSPDIEAEQPSVKEEQLALPSYPDSFNGKTFSTGKYTKKTFGAGTIRQDDALIMDGSGQHELIWNIVHTNEEIDFSKNFEISVDVGLQQHVEMGDAMVVVSLERKDEIAGKMPSFTFCELMSGPTHERNIRTKGSGHGLVVPTLNGTMKVSFDLAHKQFKCTFGNQIAGYTDVEAIQSLDARPHAVVLRSGMHIPSSYEERGTTGDYHATFDNLNVVR